MCVIQQATATHIKPTNLSDFQILNSSQRGTLIFNPSPVLCHVKCARMVTVKLLYWCGSKICITRKATRERRYKICTREQSKSALFIDLKISCKKLLLDANLLFICCLFSFQILIWHTSLGKYLHLMGAITSCSMCREKLSYIRRDIVRKPL